MPVPTKETAQVALAEPTPPAQPEVIASRAAEADSEVKCQPIETVILTV